MEGEGMSPIGFFQLATEQVAERAAQAQAEQEAEAERRIAEEEAEKELVVFIAKCLNLGLLRNSVATESMFAIFIAGSVTDLVTSASVANGVVMNCSN